MEISNWLLGPGGSLWAIRIAMALLAAGLIRYAGLAAIAVWIGAATLRQIRDTE